MSGDDWCTRFPDVACPYCGAKANAAAIAGTTEPATPKDEDRSICFTCAQPSVFVITSLGVAMRKATPEEKAEVLAEHGDQIAKIIAFNQENPRRDRR